MKITFKQQANRFLKEASTRKRNPLRPASLRTYQSQIDTHLVPLIGKKLLQDVGNKVVSEVVSALSEKGCSPRTITLNVVLIKKIRKSAVDSEGNQLYPATWSADVIDAPEVTDAKMATVTAEQVTIAISKATGTRKALFAVLAGTGLRIAEALSIQLAPNSEGAGTIWIPSESKIIVREQRTRTGIGPTKTKAGQREVDLAPELNNFLTEEMFPYLPKQMGILFTDSENSYRDSLKAAGIGGGFHTFRRFRVTHLRMNGVPEALVKYWTGHAAGNITEHYTQVAGEIESRKQHAAKAGLGFQIPTQG